LLTEEMKRRHDATFNTGFDPTNFEEADGLILMKWQLVRESPRTSESSQVVSYDPEPLDNLNNLAGNLLALPSSVLSRWRQLQEDADQRFEDERRQELEEVTAMAEELEMRRALGVPESPDILESNIPMIFERDVPDIPDITDPTLPIGNDCTFVDDPDINKPKSPIDTVDLTVEVVDLVAPQRPREAFVVSRGRRT